MTKEEYLRRDLEVAVRREEDIRRSYVNIGQAIWDYQVHEDPIGAYMMLPFWFIKVQILRILWYFNHKRIAHYQARAERELRVADVEVMAS